MSFRRSLYCLIAVAMLLSTPACRHDESYFPLNPGWCYGYCLELESGQPIGAEALKVRSATADLPSRAIEGLGAMPRLFQDRRVIDYLADDTGARWPPPETMARVVISDRSRNAIRL